MYPLIKITCNVISWLRWVLQLFGKLIPLPANKATKVHKVAWREEEASITWQRFSFQPKWGNSSLCCCGAQRLKSIASRSTLFFASFPIPNMRAYAILRPCKHHCAANCYVQSFVLKSGIPEKYSLMSINVLIQNRQRGRFFANWKAHVLFCELFPQLLMRGFPF